MKYLWVILQPGPGGICKACHGSCAEWVRRKDGQVDRRYRYPVGPCSVCNGTGGWVEQS
jgi:hypothetical protein